MMFIVLYGAHLTSYDRSDSDETVTDFALKPLVLNDVPWWLYYMNNVVLKKISNIHCTVCSYKKWAKQRFS